MNNVANSLWIKDSENVDIHENKLWNIPTIIPAPPFIISIWISLSNNVNIAENSIVEHPEAPTDTGAVRMSPPFLLLFLERGGNHVKHPDFVCWAYHRAESAM